MNVYTWGKNERLKDNGEKGNDIRAKKGSIIHHSRKRQDYKRCKWICETRFLRLLKMRGSVRLLSDR